MTIVNVLFCEHVQFNNYVEWVKTITRERERERERVTIMNSSILNLSFAFPRKIIANIKCVVKGLLYAQYKIYILG